MNNKIIKRVLYEANYILETKKTIREIAFENNISKSTVHKDLHERLKTIDNKLYIKVNKILQEHINIRHIRGGESTRQKYLKRKEILKN